MEKSTIFFSYTRKDVDFALRLAKDLRGAGADIWIDKLDIRVGARWDREVEKALQLAESLLVILTPDSVASDNVMDEINYAIQKNKKIIPVYLIECDIPFRVMRFQYIDFIKQYDIGLAELLKALNLSGTGDKQVQAPVQKVEEPTSKNLSSKWAKASKIRDIIDQSAVLKNGIVGKSYEFIFDFVRMGFSGIGEFNFEIDNKIGIKYDKKENKLFGIPQKAGEHSVLFNFKLEGQGKDEPFNSKTISLLIDPDPKSLWKNVASDRSDPYWKEDVVSVYADFGFKKLAAASKRGRSHAHEGKIRNDDFGYHFDDKTGWAIIAIADGCDSAKYSQKGCEIACKSIIDFFKNYNQEEFTEIEKIIPDYLRGNTGDNMKKLSMFFYHQLSKASYRAYLDIRNEAERGGNLIKDYSAALLFAMIKKYQDQFVIASFGVGTGLVGLYRENNEAVVMNLTENIMPFERNKFVTDSQIFTDDKYSTRISVKIREDFTALVLMTDGVADSKFVIETNFDKLEKWKELWNDFNGNNADNLKIDFNGSTKEVADNLNRWLDFWSPGNHDDRTIAILY